MTDRFAPAGNVDVAAIGSMPIGHATITPMFTWSLAIIVITTNA